MALILDATPTVYLFHPRMVGVGRIPEQGGHFPADRDVVAPRGRPDRVSYLDNLCHGGTQGGAGSFQGCARRRRRRHSTVVGHGLPGRNQFRRVRRCHGAGRKTARRDVRPKVPGGPGPSSLVVIRSSP